MFCEVIGNRFDNPELLESPNKMDKKKKSKGNMEQEGELWEN